jgi:hypothetical protein
MFYNQFFMLKFRFLLKQKKHKKHLQNTTKKRFILFNLIKYDWACLT